MSRVLKVVATSLTIMMASLAVQAQDEGEARPFAYGTYFECNTSDEWLADAIADQLFAPVYDAAVEDGTILAWGWLKHHTGGKWRRVIYHIASTLDEVFASSKAMGEKIEQANLRASDKLGQICHTHDDYIWRSVIGSGGAGSIEVATGSAKAGVSVYMNCDIAKEKRADEIVATFASAYDRQIEAGNLAGWGWLEHIVGGEYRRLLSMRGADHKSVMTAWGAIIDELAEQHGEDFQEFAQICGSHQDYLWDIR